MQINTLTQNFLEAHKNYLSETTLEWYRYYLRPLREAFGEREADSLSLSDLRAAIFSKPDLSPFSKFNFARACKRLFKWAYEESLISENPAKKLRLPPLPKKSPAGISDEDISRLLAAAQQTKSPERDYALVLFLVETGARVGGVVALCVGDVDLQKRRAVVSEKGRGGKKERTVFFSKQTSDAIQNWLAHRPTTDSDQLFLLQEQGVYQVLKRLAKQAKVKGRWNPHAFRHAFARRLLAQGMSIGIVSHLMGHSSVQVTLDFYGRFSNDELQKIYDEYSPKLAAK